MAIETGSSGQKRIIGSRRVNVPQAPTIGSLSIPSRVSKFIVKNVGSFPIRFNFNSDATSDYWTLAAGAQFPFPIDISDTTIVNATAIGGTSTVEAIFWG